MNNRIEKRYTIGLSNGNAVEYGIKRIESGETNSRYIRGYGAVFNQKSKIITEWVPEKSEYRTFYEIIAPQAFDNILANLSNYDVILNVNHRFDEILARTASKTLTISKDSKGLIYETSLPDTERGEDVLVMVSRGDYYESSFQFIVAEGGDNWTLDTNTGIYTRTITNIETLIDMCVATYRGAYSNTNIEISKGKRTEFNEYQESDILVAKQRLNGLLSASVTRTETTNPDTESSNYLIELEIDRDKINLLSN